MEGSRDPMFVGGEQVTYDPDCKKCHGTGGWRYDHNHISPCPDCCTHPQGWWKLTEHHGSSPRKYAACFKPGCGATITEAEWNALPADKRVVPSGG